MHQVRVARETEQPGVISLNSESFSVAAQSPAGTLSIDELGIFVRVAGQLQILERQHAHTPPHSPRRASELSAERLGSDRRPPGATGR